MQWIHGSSELWMQWICGCSGYVGAVDMWMQWIRGCSRYVDSVDTWMQWICGCSGFMGVTKGRTEEDLVLAP